MFFPPIHNSLHPLLTLSEKKRNLYCHDFYYELSYSIATEVLRDRFLEEIMSIGLLIIKPDAEKLGRISLLLGLLHSNGYEILQILETEITAVQTMEMWKYQWSAASIDRINTNINLMKMAPSYVLILKNPRYAVSQNCPLSAILTEQKGSADEKSRSEQHFRTVLKPLNIILNYIHTSDEPMDIIRELGILFEIDKLYEVYASLSHIYANNDSISLTKKDNALIQIDEPQKLLARVWNKIKPEIAPSAYCQLKQHFSEVYQGKNCLNLRLLQSTGAFKMWDWEWIITVSYFIEYNNGSVPIL